MSAPLSPTLSAAAGLPVYVAYWALRPGERRTFPVSRHRSPRAHKKLCRRFGGEYALEPAVFQCGDFMVVHPALFERILEALESTNDLTATVRYVATATRLSHSV